MGFPIALILLARLKNGSRAKEFSMLSLIAIEFLSARITIIVLNSYCDEIAILTDTKNLLKERIVKGIIESVS